jgi:hypothetical protein
METKDLNTTAVAKVIKDKALKEARATLMVGTHEVDTVVRIKGTITVGEDYEERIVGKADAWTLLEVALSKLNGVTVEMLVREALNGTINTETVKAQAEQAMETVKEATLTICKGKVTTKLEAEFFNTSAAMKIAAAA